MTKAEEKALELFPVEMELVPLPDGDTIEEDVNRWKRKFAKIGYEQAEKDLGWHSVDECLPEMDEEVIVLRDEYGTAPIYNVGVGHIVDRRYAMDFNGWNTPGVKFWIRFPKIPEEEL